MSRSRSANEHATECCISIRKRSSEEVPRWKGSSRSRLRVTWAEVMWPVVIVETIQQES